MKKLMMTMALLPMMALADIDNILVSRLEPWEGKVKIEYRIAGKIDVSDGMVLQAMTLNDHKSGKSYPVLSVDRRPTFEEGVHSLTWDAWADGCDIESSEASISIAIKKGSPEYCIINLSGGQNADEYPMSFLDEIPDGGWTSHYKTDNIVLHLVHPGSFAMGRKNSKYKNYRPKVTLTQPFYLGVFETTQRQWELVMGERPSRFSYTPCYATRPVENVSAKEILSDKDSFMERLSKRTGIECGVPTEAQWEYACRAGTTTDFYNGENLSYSFNTAGVEQHALDRIGRYGYNGGWFVSPENSSEFWPRLTTDHGTASVGSYEPNAWGFYDMSGNVAELCRDLFSEFVGSDGDEVVDPITIDGQGNVMKGGGCLSAGTGCMSSSRAEAKHDSGFRVFCPAEICDVETICMVQSAKTSCDFGHPHVPDVRCAGKHGELLWQYENGKLWISGSGAMPLGPHPWSFLCALVSELQIDYGVTNVAANAFAHFRNLTKLTIPNSIVHAAETAFSDCNQIADVALELSGAKVYTALPSGCEKFQALLRTVRLDNTVSSVWFNNWQFPCPNFIEYEVDSLNAVYCSENGLLLDKAKKKLYGVPFGMQYVDIPLGVVSMESAAFDSSLATAIHIPESVTLLADESLWDATPVSLKIPNSVRTIGAGVMGGSWSGEPRSLVIGEGVVSIGERAFEGRMLGDVVSIGKSVHYIGTDAFADSAPKNLYFYGAVPYGLEESGLLEGAKNVYYPKAHASSYAAVVADEQFAGFSDGVVPRIRHDIIFDAMGGECGRSQMMVLDGEKILKLPRAVRKGHRFLGWHTAHDGRGIRVTEPFSVYGSMCLYAAWEPDPSVPDSAILTHHVVFDDVHTGDAWRNFFWHVPHGETIGEMPDPDEEGYVDESLKFDGWYTKRVGGTRIEKTTKITSDLVLFAHWTYERVGDMGATWSNPRSLVVGASAKSESATLVPSDSGRGILYYKFKLRCGESIRIDIRKHFWCDFETYSEFYGSGGYADLYVHKEWLDDKMTIVATLEYGEGDEVGELMDCYWVVRGEVGEDISFTYSKDHREELLVVFEPCLGKCAEGERYISYGSEVGELPVPQQQGFSFLGWYTDQIGGTKVTSSTRPMYDLCLFARWLPDGSGDAEVCTVTFDPKGGVCAETSRSVDAGNAIGILPTCSRVGYTFDGWYTAAISGAKVTASTAVTGDMTLFAHWKQSVGYLWSENEDGSIALVGIEGEVPSILVIPAAIDGKQVKQVGVAGLDHEQGSFANLVITTLVIPEGVEELCSGAFHGCKKLTSVTLPSTLKVIRDNCFEDCSALKSIVLPEGLRRVEHDFLNRTAVSALNIPSTLIEMEEGSLAIPSCRKFTVADGNPRYRVENGYVYDYVDKVVFMRADYSKKTFVIPDGAVRIAECCFGDCDGGNITVPASVMEIGESAFCACRGLTVAFLGEEPQVAGDEDVFDGSTNVKVYVQPGRGWEDICQVGTWQGRPVKMKTAVSVSVVGSGTAKGGGSYDSGAKVPLKATPAKGCMFAGWYENEGLPLEILGADYRTASVSYVAPARNVEIVAKFIPVAEDWATVGCEIADEYVTKQAIEPVSVAFDGGSLPTVKVTGLPSGLKFTTKLVTSKVTTGTGKDRVTTLVTNALPYQIYGTPTKSGIFNAKVTVTTAGKATATKDLVFTVLDRAKGERVLRIAYDASAGKATGAGIYAADKKVTLKATAAKNCVFAGWYADSCCTEALAGSVDHRTPSFPYVMPVRDTTVWAKFMPTTEDTGITLAIDGNEVTSDAAETVFNTAGELTLALDVESVSVPKITVSGLPAGLKFTAKVVLNKDKTVLAEANTIYGTATKPGTYVVTAKLTNTTVKKAIEKKFTIVVDNLTGANDCFREPLRNGRGEKYVISAGVMEYDDVPSLMLKAVGSLKVSGLPSGMKYNAGKGCLEGRVTKAGTYTVSLTVNGKTSTFTLEVQPLPEWVVGSFEAVSVADNDLECRIVLAISSNGDVTMKWSSAEGNKVEKDATKAKLLCATDDGGFYFEHDDKGRDRWEEWNCHDTFTIKACEIDGVIVGVIEGQTSAWGIDYDDGDVWSEELVSFGVQNVWSRAAGTALCPAIGEGTQVELDMSDWTERGWNYQDGNYDLDGCFLVLTYGKNGNMSVAFFENGAAKASATAGTVLVPYELSADGKTLNALASVVLAPRGRHAISLALYFNIDVSAGVVYGSDFSLDHYYMENQ